VQTLKGDRSINQHCRAFRSFWDGILKGNQGTDRCQRIFWSFWSWILLPCGFLPTRNIYNVRLQEKGTPIELKCTYSEDQLRGGRSKPGWQLELLDWWKTAQLPSKFF
jgi:hypothetical protein